MPISVGIDLILAKRKWKIECKVYNGEMLYEVKHNLDILNSIEKDIEEIEKIDKDIAEVEAKQHVESRIGIKDEKMQKKFHIDKNIKQLKSERYNAIHESLFKLTDRDKKFVDVINDLYRQVKDFKQSQNSNSLNKVMLNGLIEATKEVKNKLRSKLSGVYKRKHLMIHNKRK